jgi:predicted AAA+ superfamily ATPase
MIENTVNIALDELALYDNIRTDTAAAKATALANAIARGKGSDDARLRSLYYDVQRELVSERPRGFRGSCWQARLCRLMAESENAFSLQGEHGAVTAPVAALAAREIAAIRGLFLLDWASIAELMGDGACVAAMDAAEMEAGGRVAASARPAGGLRGDLREGLRDALSAKDSVAAAAACYERHGCGLFGLYDAFCWEGGLSAVDAPDAASFDDLIGYEAQKRQIIENTARFMDGLPYANMLLYGDRGTGKSSSVKALLRMFAPRGLRLVALPRDAAGDLPALMGLLAPRGCRFIVFIDDLSFEENETGYKPFKSALEGGVHPRPPNTLICATSNRRNIIKELWREREGLEDVGLNDALQEKRSLADRFGLTVTFSAPDKDEYLEIVRGIARREGLDAEMDGLEREAMQWEIRHSGRSGRAARQFVERMAATKRSGPSDMKTTEKD